MSKIKSNVSVNYNEGLYYVSYSDIYIFQSKNDNLIVTESNIPENESDSYDFQPVLTQQNYEKFRKQLTHDLLTLFPSMSADDSYLNKSKTQRSVVSNTLFTIALEDNEWSVAVKLLRNKKANKGLQEQMYSSFLHGLRNSLFKQFETLYVRTSSWSVAPITQSSPADAGNMIIQNTSPEQLNYAVNYDTENSN